jgi:hypothetical protein
MKVSFPWEKLKPGQGFFVPALDVERMKEMGLRAAVLHRVKAEAIPGIRDGKIGVWFYIKQQPSALRALRTQFLSS